MHTRIKIVGIGDAKTKALRENLLAALTRYPVDVELAHISEVHQIERSGATSIPALDFDGQIVSEGEVPSVEQLMELLRNRSLYRSKLYVIEKILVPTDFSAASKKAFKYALEIAKIFDASVQLLHVGDILHKNSLEGALIGDASYQKTVRADMEAWINECAPPKGAPLEENEEWHRCSSRLDFGFPEQVIIDMSSEYDLVVMGTQGKQGLLSEIVGSVSLDVAKHAHCPVVVIPPNYTYTPIKKILYSSNFDSLDVEKMRQVIGFAKKLDAQVYFVHVGTMLSSKEALEQELFKMCYAESIPDKPFLFRTLSDEGSLSKTLNQYAEEENIDLSVVVTHRRGLLERFLHKSATKDMVFNGKYPLLAVHKFNDITRLGSD